MTPEAWRSLLFVPATRPDRFAKALASGADAVCVDLEDAVSDTHKEAAREAAIAFLSQSTGDVSRLVRINPLNSLAGLRDLLAVIEARPPSGAIAVPKLADRCELQLLEALLQEADLPLAVVAQIESTTGVENAFDIAAAGGRVCAIMFGGLDLAAELGVPASWETLLYARSRLVHAAARAGLPCIDMPFTDIADAEGCRGEALRAQRLGFTAKMAIHPAQVTAVNDAFTPPDELVAHAKNVTRALEESADGVTMVDGRMVERPVVAAMRRILARARLGPSP